MQYGGYLDLMQIESSQSNVTTWVFSRGFYAFSIILVRELEIILTNEEKKEIGSIPYPSLVFMVIVLI